MRLKVRVLVLAAACLALMACGVWAWRGLQAPKEPQQPSPPELVYLRTNREGFREYRNPKDGSEVVLVPAGPFAMGSDADPHARPAHKVELGAYYLGRLEVTNRQFKRFLRESGYQVVAPRWDVYDEPGREDYPVVHVSWFDAVAYCQWAGMRLPSEAEWEKAARGPKGWKYPWGPTWDRNRCNNMAMDDPALLKKMVELDAERGTTPVGSFPSGASPYGVLDLLGNAVEWCSSKYKDYPYRATDGREEADTGSLRVLRGGCWFNQAQTLTGYSREKSAPEYWYYFQYTGFRVAGTAPEGSPR